MTLFVLALHLATAQAADCKPALATFKEASPVATAAAWSALVACDAKLGLAQLDDGFGRMLPGDGADDALVLALEQGRAAQVSGWIARQQPNDQSAVRAALGRACDAHAPVQAYLLGLATSAAAEFWEKRWYRSVGDCHSPEARGFLEAQLDTFAGKPQGTTFSGLVEVYARSLRGDALPKLTALAETATDEPQLIAIVSAFGDAADVGSVGARNHETAQAASEVVLSLAPKMSFRTVEAARATLRSMDQQDAANALAAYRWPNRKSDDRYRYGIAAREIWTCANGKSFATLHLATVDEGGSHWSDQLVGLLEQPLTDKWGLGVAAKKCKGEATVRWDVTPKPYGEGFAEDKWLDKQRDAMTSEAGAAKQSTVTEAVVTL